MNIAIIGAGLSGTELYRKLKKDNHTVTIFEKSRGYGGRCSTRYIENNFIDHGTPYFEAKSIEFKSFCDEHVKDNNLVKNNDTYYPQKGINKLCSNSIVEDDIIKNTKIVACEYQNGAWMLEDDSGVAYKSFDSLILTIPTPQILSMDIKLSTYIKDKLLSVQYDSVATLMMYTTKQEKIECDKIMKNDVFKKVINNSSKYGYENFRSYVLHLNQKLTNEQNFISKNEIKNFICNELFKITNIQYENKFHLLPHFWKYALVSKGLETDFLYEDKISLGFCGDYFSVKNLEGAYLSAIKLYEKKFKQQ